MKVTTELKSLIKRSFGEKKILVQKEAEKEAREEYEAVFNDVANSEEFAAYVKAANALYERVKSLSTNSYGAKCRPYYASYRTEDLKDIKPEHIIRDNVSSFVKYNDKIMGEVEGKIRELDLAQESLMIKLTYEKDLDKVRAMLAEYDITI